MSSTTGLAAFLAFIIAIAGFSGLYLTRATMVNKLRFNIEGSAEKIELE